MIAFPFYSHLHPPPLHFLLPDSISFDQDEMVNSDEKNEELETFPPSDNDTLFNQKKEQKQNLKRIILSMIAFSVVSLLN